MSNASLISNIQEQLGRLVEQLNELEQEKANLESEEYDEMKRDTMEQLEELSSTLEKMEGGNMTLIDDLTATKMAVRAAISSAFRTPEIISLFARKQPAIIRQKLAQLDAEWRLKKVDASSYTAKRVEMLGALQRLRDPLSAEETEFLCAHGEQEWEMERASEGTTARKDVLE